MNDSSSSQAFKYQKLYPTWSVSSVFIVLYSVIHMQIELVKCKHVYIYMRYIYNYLLSIIDYVHILYIHTTYDIWYYTYYVFLPTKVEML